MKLNTFKVSERLIPLIPDLRAFRSGSGALTNVLKRVQDLLLTMK